MIGDALSTVVFFDLLNVTYGESMMREESQGSQVAAPKEWMLNDASV